VPLEEEEDLILVINKIKASEVYGTAVQNDNE